MLRYFRAGKISSQPSRIGINLAHGKQKPSVQKIIAANGRPEVDKDTDAQLIAVNWASMETLWLDVQVLHIQCIVFDEFTPCLDIFAHQGGEDRLRLCNVLKFDGKQRAMLRVHRRLPELRRSHLTQAFVALHLVLAP